MDLHDLFLSCRRGDLERVKYLIEQRDVNINVKDRWDSSPLYYACLCGHIDTVRYLLENGARCEANTFDGERCLYGALNQEIRHLLRNYKVITAHTIRRELYQEFLRKLLEGGEYADVVFDVHGKKFSAHKCILAARSDYFLEMFMERWKGRNEINITHELVNPFAFQAILQYLYTAGLQIHVEYIDDLIRLARQCNLQSLIENVEKTTAKAHFFQSTKPGTRVTTLVIEPAEKNLDLLLDFGVLSEDALPLEYQQWVGNSELPFFPQLRAPFADVIFDVDGHRFLCHQAFFCSRSEYFKTMLRDPFAEQSSCWDLPVIFVRNVAPIIFVQILYYIYQESVELNANNVYEVLLAADMFLLPGLKRLCAAMIAEYLELDTVCHVLRTARMFELHRLEDACYDFMARNIPYMIENADFKALVVEDAKALHTREEADTIDVIDNIRFHLTATSIDDAQDNLEMIDSLLESLSLEG